MTDSGGGGNGGNAVLGGLRLLDEDVAICNIYLKKYRNSCLKKAMQLGRNSQIHKLETFGKCNSAQIRNLCQNWLDKQNVLW